MSKTIKISIPACTTIDDAAKSATKMADHLYKSVQFDFNGILVTAVPNVPWQRVADQYYSNKYHREVAAKKPPQPCHINHAFWQGVFAGIVVGVAIVVVIVTLLLT